MLAIFDLDGTLLNTIADLAAATNHALEAEGYPTHNPESYNFMVGNGVAKLLERALPEDARTPENVARLRTHFQEYYGSHMADFTQPYPGIPELLGELRARKVSVAVASNKYQAAVDRLIRHFFPTVEWKRRRGSEGGRSGKARPLDCVRHTREMPHAQE